MNPYLPSWEYIPDGEPYVFHNRVYVYGSHDRFNGHAYCLNDYVCWSAPVDDLTDWRYEDVIYQKTDDPLNSDGSMCLYAPDVTVGPDGRYYLYYVLDKVSIVSVAVCDTPAGKYKFYGYVHYSDGTRLGDREGDQPQFDPGVMTEGEYLIDLLPALPVQWSEGAVTGLRARGGFEVTMAWGGGQLESAHIRSLHGSGCTLRYRNETIKCDAQAGEEFYFCPCGSQ